MRRLFLAIAFCLPFLALLAAPWLRNEDFHAAMDARGISLFQEAPTEASKADDDRLRDILQQPFTYLGEGGQSFVFASADGNYVIKIFNIGRMRPVAWILSLPDWPLVRTYKQEHLEKRQRRLERVFNGHRLAYEKLRDESALIALHLAPSQIETLVRLYDKHGQEHQVDLSHDAFVIQKKSELVSALFKRLLDADRVDDVTARIEGVFALYRSEFSQGIRDRDHGIMHNVGFIDEKPMHMDVGMLMRDEQMQDPAKQSAELAKVGAKIKSWVRKHYPLYNEKLSDFIDSRLGAPS